MQSTQLLHVPKMIVEGNFHCQPEKISILLGHISGHCYEDVPRDVWLRMEDSP